MAATLREKMIDAVLQCVEGDWLLKLCCHFCHMLVVCVVKPYDCADQIYTQNALSLSV